MSMRVGVFEVTKADGGALQPVPQDGARIPDRLAGCIQAMAAEETSARGGVVVKVSGPGHIGLSVVVPSIDVLNISKVVRDPSEYGRGSRILMKTGWFGGGVGGRAQKYLIAKLGPGVEADLKKLNDGRLCCLLATIFKDENQVALTGIIRSLAEGQNVDIAQLTAVLTGEERRMVHAFVFSGKIEGKADGLQRLTPPPLPPELRSLQDRMDAFFGQYNFYGVAQQRLALDNTPAGVLRLGLVTPDELTGCFRTTRPLLNPRIQQYLSDFLDYKKAQGTAAEQALYATMTPAQLLDRLVGPNNKRWAVFLPEGRGEGAIVDVHGASLGELPASGQESAVFLRDHLSWDEVFISSLISVSAKTPFLHCGARGRDRGDSAAKDGHRADDGHVPMGVYTGSVGSYFRRPDIMDHRFMVVTPSHTADRGYGPKAPDAAPRGLEDIAARMFGVDHLPTIEEARADTSGRFIKVDGRAEDEYLDTQVYKERLKLVVEPFLRDAAARTVEGQKAYVRIDGLGLGVWSLQGIGHFGTGGAPMPMSVIQAQLMRDVYREILTSDHVLSAKISTVDFRWINGISPSDGSVHVLETAGEGTNIIATRSNPADPLPRGHENDLLVAQWAWDGNSMTGNEWWNGCGSFSSSDPAAVACSLVGFTHNGAINPLMQMPGA